MTTAAYNADNPCAIAVGSAGGRKTGSTSYVLCHQPKSFDWRLCGGKPHPMKRVDDAHFAEVLAVLNQIVQLG
jgi:mRNA interferase MazF